MEQPWYPWHRFQHLYRWIAYRSLLPKWVFVEDFLIFFTRKIGPHDLPKLDRGDVVRFLRSSNARRPDDRLRRSRASRGRYFFASISIFRASFPGSKQVSMGTSSFIVSFRWATTASPWALLFTVIPSRRS